MNTIAKHLTADLYGCKIEAMTDKGAAAGTVTDILQSAGYSIMNLASENIADNHFVVTAIFDKGHIVLHVYAELHMAAADVFLCRDDAEPEMLFKEIRNFFKPEKTRITILKRGNFKQGSDLKPKTKTRVAPLRKIHNTGAKVIRSLARRK